MGCNHEKWHLFIKPEDDANRQIVNGFVMKLSMEAQSKIHVDKPANGYHKALEFIRDANLERYPQRRLLVVIDYDRSVELRQRLVNDYAAICDRVFVLGAQRDAEALKRSLQKSFAKCGAAIADDCASCACELWNNSTLNHNREFLDRLCPEIARELFGK